MPDGPVMAKLPRLIRIPPGRAWIAFESPRGQYGCYAISDGSDQPFRLRIHDPSYFNLQAVGALMPGNLIADTMADHGQPRPGHGRRRQVSTATTAPSGAPGRGACAQRAKADCGGN